MALQFISMYAYHEEWLVIRDMFMCLFVNSALQQLPICCLHIVKIVNFLLVYCKNCPFLVCVF